MALQDATSRRAATLAALGARNFDLLVVGGGVTGCGIARDAALRGFSVALVEKTDFAAGTSSKSSKLIHGGLRYLEHAQFKLVFEGTNERALLLKRAPHLVKPLPFLVPAYAEPGHHALVKLDVGLWIYDALSKFSSPKLHKTFRGKSILNMEPMLRTEALKGGIIYYDCLTNDARVTLENALDAGSCGATVANYVRARSLATGPEGRVTGVVVEPTLPGDDKAPITVRARVTVNATGPWSDELRKLHGEAGILSPTKGVHLVVDEKRLPIKHAITMLSRRDHRVMFAIPWGEGRTVLGTTDTYYDGSFDRVYATKDDADYLLETVNYYFPSAKLTRDDVLATWAGLRPLVKPNAGVVDASDVSREHHLIVRPGFITIAGGKLTTYRRMAGEVVDKVGAQLGRIPPSLTEERPLPGALGLDGAGGLASLEIALAERGLAPPVARHLADTYGVRATAIAARADEDPSALHPLDPELPCIAAEVDEAVETELACRLDDVLGRRTQILLRARDQGLAIAPWVAARMGRRLGWDETRVREEVEHYAALVEDTRRFRA